MDGVGDLIRVLAIVYERDAGPGVFIDAAHEAGVELDQWFRTEEAAPPRAIDDYDAVVSLGGSMNADQEDRFPWLGEEKALLAGLIERGTPTLAVCLGAQLLSDAAGAPPHHAEAPEVGWYDVEVSEEGAADPVLGALAPRFEAFQWHGSECELPSGAIELARSPAALQAYRVGDAAWGIQFHPEITAADLESWIRDYGGDDEVARAGTGPEQLREQSRGRIDAWNQTGRDLFRAFLKAAQKTLERRRSSE